MKKYTLLILTIIPSLSNAEVPFIEPFSTLEREEPIYNKISYDFWDDNTLYTVNFIDNNLVLVDLNNLNSKRSSYLNSTANKLHNGYLYAQNDDHLVRFTKDGKFKTIIVNMKNKLHELHSSHSGDYIHAGEFLVTSASSKKPKVVSINKDYSIVSHSKPYYGKDYFVESGMSFDKAYTLKVYDASNGNIIFEKKDNNRFKAPKTFENKTISYIENDSVVLWNINTNKMLDKKSWGENIKHAMVERDKLFIFFNQKIIIPSFIGKKIKIQKECQLEDPIGNLEFLENFSNDNYFYISSKSNPPRTFIYKWDFMGCNKIAEIDANVADYRMHPTKPIIAYYDVIKTISFVKFDESID